MRTAAFALAAAAVWPILIYKLWQLRRDPHNPFLRSFTGTVAAVAVAFTLGLPPILLRLENSTGVLAAWCAVPVVVGCACTQTTLLLWTYPAEHARRKIRPRWVLYGTALVATLVLDLIGRVPPGSVAAVEDPQVPEVLYGRIPNVAESTLIYAAT